MPRAVHDPAIMGYIGGVLISKVGETVRATSASLNAKQTIDHPEVIDGTTDWSLYQLKGIEIDGDVAMPVVTGAFLSSLFQLIKRRQSDGGMDFTDVTIAYGKNGLVRTFQDCLVNTLELKGTAGERVDVTVNFWGRRFTEGGGGINPPSAVERVLAWADVNIGGGGIAGNGACDIREFSINVNNTLSRNYTFCAQDGYYPNNISAGKRQVSGSLGFLGPATSPTPTDPSTGLATDQLNALTFQIGTVGVTCNGIVYEYQNIEAQPGVITSTVNWYAHSVSGDAITS